MCQSLGDDFMYTTVLQNGPAFRQNSAGIENVLELKYLFGIFFTQSPLREFLLDKMRE